MTDRELLNCLTDRPCDVCKFHGENGCSQWTCVFCDDLFGDMRTKQETSDDLISRDAVINLIRDCNNALEEPRIFDCHNAGVKFEQYITELPSVNTTKNIVNNGTMNITL